MDLYYGKAVNTAQLYQELVADPTISGAPLAGVAQDDGGAITIVQFSDDVSQAVQDAVTAVINGHDAGVLTVLQQIEADAETASADLKTIIGNRIAWHETNPATAGNAVEVVQHLQDEMTHLMKRIRREL